MILVGTILVAGAAIFALAIIALVGFTIIFVPAIIALVGFATICAPAILALVGFTTAGVAAGSLAAGMQAGIGSVAAGSLFAILQSLGTASLFTGLIGAVTGAAGTLFSMLI